jgi:hypothetical protein
MVQNDELKEFLDLDFIEELNSFLIGISDFDNILVEMKERDLRKVFRFGVVCLLSFVQFNWTGPLLQWNSYSLFNNDNNNVSGNGGGKDGSDGGSSGSIDGSTSGSSGQKEWNLKWSSELMVNGEEPYHLTIEPFLLYLSKTILFGCEFDCKTINWWRARCLFINQRILENYSQECKETILDLYETVNQLPLANLRAEYHLELAMVHHHYNNDQLGLMNIRKAQEITGLEWNVTGIMGKRTKFQSFETPQLAVTATSLHESNVAPFERKKEKNAVPESIKLNDDVLLESIEFSSTAQQNLQLKNNLNPIDQCILLAFCLFIKNTNPNDGLTVEQMLPFVSRVLENPNNWMINTMALLLKSRLESNRSRTVERSCLQLQVKMYLDFRLY